MKKKWLRMISTALVLTMILGSVGNVFAGSVEDPAAVPVTADEDEQNAPADNGSVPADTEQNSGTGSDGQNASNGQDTSGGSDTSKDPEVPKGEETPDAGTGTKEPETETSDKSDVSGTVTTDTNEDVKGAITVEEDKNDDKVEIKKNDRPYLALGENLTPEQRATVLAIMGIDSNKLADYDVVYVNNAEEHQYLNSYIDSSKIGTKSLSSVVIMEREKGNGINVSTNNITYCTVGMYKNALATAGIENADIIVAAPFPISGTAALVGVFKAYKEMTGDEIDEENIDAALHELVVTGALESAGADSDEIEGMIAYVKQAVVEHDLSDESEIRSAIEEGCEKFDLTLTDEEKAEVVQLMKKISDLDLDLDGLLNAAQSIYDKIQNADGGFWAKIRELLNTIVEKIKELF